MVKNQANILRNIRQIPSNIRLAKENEEKSTTCYTSLRGQ